MSLTFKRLQQRAFLKTSLEEQQARTEGGVPLRRCLGAFDVLLIGIGGTIGSGLFVVTGVAASEHAGPAVVLSYVMAAFAALLSGLCYTQLVVEMPVTGGATFYMANIFGELSAWIVAANLILEYSLSVAAVGRSASGYFATLLGFSPTFFMIPLGPVRFDPCSLVLVLLLSALLAYGTEASNMFNIAMGVLVMIHALSVPTATSAALGAVVTAMGVLVIIYVLSVRTSNLAALGAVVTAMNIVVIIYVLCAGFPYGAASNLVPFAPFGARGVFTASSIVFFSFVGFDAVATAAEEVHTPEVDMPVGMVGSILVSALLYVLMSLCICAMQASPQIDLEAPFAAAFTSLIQPGTGSFQRVFLATSARFVSFGALTGIITSLLVSILGQARIYVVLGRERLLPRWLARVHPVRNTPVNATWLTGVSSGLLACLIDIDVLAELVSIGTLFVFFMVACAVLWQRYLPTSGSGASVWPLRGILSVNIALALGLSATYTFRGPTVAVAVLAGLWVLSACSFSLLQATCLPEKFAVPLTPFLPSLAMLVTLHLIGSLGWKAYVRFGIWLVLSLLVYVFYGVHSAAEADEERLINARSGGQEEVPLNMGASSDEVQLSSQGPSRKESEDGAQLQAGEPSPGQQLQGQRSTLTPVADDH